MSWFTNFLTSSIGRKIIMSLTGLFLCLFLVIHVAGNTQLFLNDGGEAFNKYTYKMVHSPLIKIASYLTYLAILLHAIQGIYLAYINRKAKGGKYAVNAGGKNSSWASRSMAFLGTVVFVFIVVHLQNFWYKLKFGTMPPAKTYADGKTYEDMYTVVSASFQDPLLVGLYVVAMTALALHLIHGFQSGFQSLGLNHKKYTPIIKGVSTFVFGILIPALFAAMPLYFFFVK